jgi:hypothetical protein
MRTNDTRSVLLESLQAGAMLEGNEDLRTTFLDFDARRDPKTDVWCARCQKDLKPDQKRYKIHLVNGGPYILHPGDEDKYVPDRGDYGWFLLGADCAAKIGLEWVWPTTTTTEAVDAGQPDLETLEASPAWVATLEGAWGFACVMRSTGGYVLQVPGFQALAPGTSVYSPDQVKDLVLVRGALPESADTQDWVVVIGRDYFDSFLTKKLATEAGQSLRDQGRDAYIFRRADYDRFIRGVT